MDEERVKKIEAGREQLQAYKKKKHKRDKLIEEDVNSDSSLSFSSPDLPDNTNRNLEEESVSESSTISEHLYSNHSSSVENDRSLQELEVPNSNFLSLFQNFPSGDEYDRISQENKPPSINSSFTSDVCDKDNSTVNNVQIILNEILHNEQFISNSDRSESDSLGTNDTSLNIFEGVSLDDSSINNYVTKLRQFSEIDSSLNEKNRNVTIINEFEKQLNRKDSELALLSAELESLKDLVSHQSSDLNTATTDYKVCQDDHPNRFVDFQNAVAHRDTLIEQLTESLQQSISNREELQQQSENFAREIAQLQKQLTETSNVIKLHKCFNSEQQSPSRKSPNQTKGAQFKESLSVASIPLNLEKVAQSLETVAQEKAVEMNLEEECSKLEEILSPNQLLLMNDLKIKINMYIQGKIAGSRSSQKNEVKILKDRLQTEKSEHEVEVGRLRTLLSSVKCESTDIMDLKKELDAKHAREMEELRTYFEKKCSDLEKNYSEEIFSQQSRKMSGSSSSSVAELVHDAFEDKQIGPGGDADPSNRTSKMSTPKRAFRNFSKDDLANVKSEMSHFWIFANKYDPEDVTKEDVDNFKQELLKCKLPTLTKFKFNEMKTDLLNKYHAELEILRDDYENRIDEINVENENNVKKLREGYQEQVDALRYELDEALRTAQMNISTAVQEVASSGDYELAEVVQSYERRLQEQVILAKIDIIGALEHQIQMLANSSNDAQWPTELLQIKNRFAEKYEREIEELKQKHVQEIVHLKEEHFKVLNGALERSRRRSLRENESFTENDIEIINDRDNQKKTNTILRNLLGELLKYFTQCEDELNKTLVEEIMKHGFEKNLTQIENDLNDSSSSDSFITKRVHLTPNFEDFMNIVDSSTISSFDSKDLSMDLRNELISCLDRLKSDANSILALTTNIHKNGPRLPGEEEELNTLEEKVTSLTRQIITGAQVREELELELDGAKDYARNLESERVSLENQVEQLVANQKVLEYDLLESNKKIADLIECGHKEIVSEGYGQNSRSNSLGAKVATLSELQDRARQLVTEWKNGADHPLIQLVEELCREGERITDEAKKEKEDLTQQIEAADKKLRSTDQFLDQQAMEREQERDEAQREIAALREQLKEKEKEKQTRELVAKEDAACLELNPCCQVVLSTINSTVELLENQMREMTKLIELGELKRQEVETERKEAVDKIYVLRDIIRDLEVQVEKKTASEAEKEVFAAQLEAVAKQQSETIHELTEQVDLYKLGPDVDQLKDRIVYLENETQKLRLNNELAGSEGAIKEIQIQLHEFEMSIDKKTKGLEGLHCALSTTTCSTPSEEMSIRDQIRPQTPNSVLEECDVPLQQLARLKEKLIKHSRAEDAAVKRIRDLDMQLNTMKQDLEEVQNEKEILQNQVTEQIVLLSSLQMRLDEQRLRAEHNQKQANTSLELRIYDLENDVQSLKDILHGKEKLVRQLNKIIEETKQRLEDRERELSNKEDDETMINLQGEIDQLRQENLMLKTKIDSDAQNAQILPGLVDNIISDKNADIEKLRFKLDDTQKQLESFLSLNLDRDQLRQLSQLKCNERAFSDILSLTDLQPDVTRKAPSRVESFDSGLTEHFKRNRNEITMVGGKPFESEISTIEKSGPASVNITDNLTKANSTEIHKSLDRKVHFQDVECLEKKIVDLRNQLSEKEDLIKEYLEKINSINNLEINVAKLETELETTEETLNNATKTFEKEQNFLKVDLAEKKMFLSEKEKELKLSEDDHRRKDEMYMNLAKEKRELELKLNELQQDLEQYKDFDSVVNEKNKEIYRLEDQLAKLLESCVALEIVEEKLRSKELELDELQDKHKSLQHDFDEKTRNLEHLRAKFESKNEENQKLIKELNNQTQQVDILIEELNILKNKLDEKSKDIERLDSSISVQKSLIISETGAEIKKLKELVVDKDLEIEILNEDLTRYQNDLQKYEDQLKGSELELESMKHRKAIAQKDLEIVKLKTMQDDLKKEIRHLQDYLQEKDRVIEQMQEDTKSLHLNLETIQNKIRETGNIVDLRKRIQEEQHLNAVLKEEITLLKQSMEIKERSPSIEDIRGEVQKQLEYSAHLDSSILQAISSGDEMNEPVVTKETFEKNQLRLEIQDLENCLEEEKAKVFKLSNLLEKEKHLCNSIQIEDMNLIEKMRIQLETALDNVTELENMLEIEKKDRSNLENQLKKLKLKDLSNSSNSRTELTEYKTLPNMDSQEMFKLKEEMSSLNEMIDKLKTDLKSLRGTKTEQDADLKYTRDVLALKSSELEKMEEKFDNLRKNEDDLKGKLNFCKTELDQKIRENENNRLLMSQMEKERIEMKKETIILAERLRELQSHQKVDLSTTVPEKVIKKMEDLTNDAKRQMEENKMITETLTKMSSERSKLLDKIRQLEERNTYRMPFDDPTARANHLFGKYLRAESYRKALIWQKTFLIKLLVSYQSIPSISKDVPTFDPKYPTKIRSRGKQKFKCYVTSLIAIARMKFMVKRWHSGRRQDVYATVPRRNAGHVQEINVENGADNRETRFQVGQPVSSQNFYPTAQFGDARHLSPLPRSPLRDNVGERNREDRRTPADDVNVSYAWSGSTPPQKEKKSATNSVAPDSNHLAALESPHPLSEYVRRFNDIQQRLGMTFDKLNS